MRPLVKVRAKNFRSLRDVEVELQPLNVLVGPNASGKSNFLDLIAFLRDAVHEDLWPAVAERGGLNWLVFRGPLGRRAEVEISVEAIATQHASERARDAYTLRFGGGRSTPSLKPPLRREEEFSFKRTRSSGRRLTIKGHKLTIYDTPKDALKPRARTENLLQEGSLGLSTLPRLVPDLGGEQVGAIADLFSNVRIFDVNVQAARQPSPVRLGESLHPNASNLAAFLYNLSDDPHTYRDLEDDARAMIPGLSRLHFRPIGGADEAVAVELQEKGLRGHSPLAHASYGSIRALALLALLYDPSPPLLTCVEEIDHGLHPYVFDRLVERLRDASKRSQFLVVTHSPALVNRLHASELIVCERDRETGETLMPAVDPAEVRKIEEKLAGKMGLGELWFSGTLGGNP